MNPIALTLVDWLAGRLVLGSLQAIVLVLVVWVLCRRRLRVSAGMQAALWWAAMLRLVLVFAPIPGIPIPVLPADVPPVVASPALPLDVPVSVSDSATTQQTERDTESWVVFALGLWLLGLGWHGARLLSARRAIRLVVRRATPSDEDADIARQPRAPSRCPRAWRCGRPPRSTRRTSSASADRSC
jgi:beta-lactamase regulating signal transducer with metallopeptidase domain